MPIIKQSFPLKYIESALGIVDYINEEDSVGLEEHSYYSECCSMLDEVRPGPSPYLVLFDYYFFKYSKGDFDCSGDIKKLYKLHNIDHNDLLVYIKELLSYSIRVKDRYAEDSESVSDTALPCITIFLGFVVFLVYVFDLCTANKKLASPTTTCKFKDLDNYISYLAKKVPKFKKEIEMTFLLSLYGDEVLPAGMKRVFNVDKVSTATFQKYKLKHDYILIQHLIKSLLVEESSYYSARHCLDVHAIGSLMSELKENEFNLDLSTEFYVLLRKRAYLLPYNGISITPSKIEFSIDVYERQLDGDNYLIVITNKEEFSYFTFINLTKGYTVNNSPWLYDICNFLYSFYKLEGPALELYGESFTSDPLLVLSYKFDSFLSTGIETIKGRSDVYKDFIVESPYYWRYKGDERKRIDNKSFYKESTGETSFKYISAFKRGLPSGYKASDDAKSVSKLYCIELKDGETLVSPFVRSYSK